MLRIQAHIIPFQQLSTDCRKSIVEHNSSSGYLETSKQVILVTVLYILERDKNETVPNPSENKPSQIYWLGHSNYA